MRGAEASRLGRTKLHSAVCISAPTVAAAFKFGTRVRMLYAHVLLHFQSTILDGSRVGSHPTHARARTHPPHACTHLRSQPTPRLYLLQPSMYHMCISLCQVSEREHVWFGGAQPLPLSAIRIYPPPHSDACSAAGNAPLALRVGTSINACTMNIVSSGHVASVHTARERQQSVFCAPTIVLH